MIFPLISLPKRVMYVDDKGAFLDALRRVMPRTHAQQFLTSPSAAIDRIGREARDWKDLEQVLSTGDDDASDDTQLPLKLVTRHFGSASRFNLTSVLIVDYSMPGLTGLDLIRRLNAWPGRKLLLTGEADASVAISAFNEGLIQKFIPKSTSRLYNVLKSSYEEMHGVVCEQLGHLLRPRLTSWQKELLQDDRVVGALNRKLEELEWSEYVVVGKPFGLFGLTHAGPLQWLQLETSDTLPALAELMAAQGFTDGEVQYVLQGREIANCEIHQALELPNRAMLAEGEYLSSNPDLICAVFSLDHDVVTAESQGVSDRVSPIDEMRPLFAREGQEPDCTAH